MGGDQACDSLHTNNEKLIPVNFSAIALIHALSLSLYAYLTLDTNTTSPRTSFAGPEFVFTFWSMGWIRTETEPLGSTSQRRESALSE